VRYFGKNKWEVGRMEIIQFIATVLAVLVLLFLIYKKVNVIGALLSLGFIILAILTVATGQSVLGDKTTGSLIIDLFELITNTAIDTTASTGMVIMAVMGYVAYMNHIKASQLFGVTAAKPLRKLKSPYAVVFLAILIGALLKIVIPSGSSLIALMVATVYPILRACGVSSVTAASTILIGTGIMFGPAHTVTYTAFGIAGITEDLISVPMFFATMELPVVIPTAIVVGIVTVLTSRFFDKRDNYVAESVEVGDTEDKEELNIPLYYAFFPLLPLTLILIFSDLVVGSIVISVVAAHLLSFTFVFILRMIKEKERLEIFNDFKVLFNAMGVAFATVVSVVIAGKVFANGINAIGGMQVIAEVFKGHGGIVSVTIVGVILYFCILAITASVNGSIPIFAAMFANTASGMQLVEMMRPLLLAGGFGYNLSPVSPGIIILSSTCKVDIITIIKRVLIPSIAGSITALTISVLLMA
jgi:DcuC family C4-dicarboxylate transporter